MNQHLQRLSLLLLLQHHTAFVLPWGQPRATTSNTQRNVQTFDVDSIKTSDGGEEDDELRKQITNKYADLYEELMHNETTTAGMNTNQGLLSLDEFLADEKTLEMQKQIEKDEEELVTLMEEEESLEVPNTTYSAFLDDDATGVYVNGKPNALSEDDPPKDSSYSGFADTELSNAKDTLKENEKKENVDADVMDSPPMETNGVPSVGEASSVDLQKELTEEKKRDVVKLVKEEEEVAAAADESIPNSETQEDEALAVVTKPETPEVLPVKRVTVREPFWTGVTHQEISDSLVRAVTPRESVEDLLALEGTDLFVATAAYMGRAALSTGKAAVYCAQALQQALTDEEVLGFASEAKLESAAHAERKATTAFARLEAAASTCSAAAQCLRSSEATRRALEAVADTTQNLVSAVASGVACGIKSASGFQDLFQRVGEQVRYTKSKWDREQREQRQHRQAQKQLEERRRLVARLVDEKQAAAETALETKMDKELAQRLKEIAKARETAKQQALETIRRNAKEELKQLVVDTAFAMSSMDETSPDEN